MEGNENEGSYCSICGGIPPDKIKVRKVLIEGKETGIDQLDFIIGEVKKLRIDDDAQITEELMKRVRAFNYVPTKKAPVYESVILAEYKKPVE